MAKPNEAQLAKINRFAKTPVSADDVHVHPFRLLGTGYIPSRYLTFDRSLLDIYLRNVNNGDVVQIADHSFGNGFIEKITLPFGRFFEGEIVADGDKLQLDGSMYMPKNNKTYIGDFTTDDISQQIDAGILHDSSVSVTWGYSECSICHNDIRDYENCRHYPGRVYKDDGEEVLCTVIAKPAPPPKTDNSMMIENSIVCAGAYPDAGVLGLEDKPPGKVPETGLNSIASLKLLAKPETPVFCCFSPTSVSFRIEGKDVRDASDLHHIYHDMQKTKELPEGWTFGTLNAKHKEVVKTLLDEGHDHFLIDALDGTLSAELKAKSKKGSDNMPNDEITAKLTLDIEKLTEQLKQAEEKFTADLAAKDSEIDSLKAKVDELTPLADLGTKYREDVVATALKSGVRDQGNDFKEDTYKKMFANLSIDEIKEMGEAWEASALAKLGAPSHTKGDKFELPGNEIKAAVNPELYKVGR